MSINIILSDAYLFFTRNLRQIFSLCFPFLLADSLIGLLFAGNEGIIQPFSLISFFALYPIYTVALILFMAKSANHEQAKNTDLIAEALTLWGPFLTLTLVSLFITALGLIAFIVPGIYISVRLAFGEFYLILFGLKPMEAIRLSYKSTKNYFWPLLSFLLFFFGCNWILGFSIDRLFENGVVFPILRVTIEALLSFIALFLDVIFFRIFMEAVAEKPSIKPAIEIDTDIPGAD